MAKPSSPSLAEAKTFVKELGQQDFDDFMARVSVHSTILQPNDVLYLPAAYLVMDKHVGALSMGLRFSCLQRCAFSHPAFGLADLATLAEWKMIAGPAQQALDVMRASRDALMGEASMMDDYKATFQQAFDHGLVGH